MAVKLIKVKKLLNDVKNISDELNGKHDGHRPTKKKPD